MSAITVKGQVTVPKQIRDALGLTPGSHVEFGVDEQGRVILQRADAPRRRSIARTRATSSRGENGLVT